MFLCRSTILPLYTWHCARLAGHIGALRVDDESLLCHKHPVLQGERIPERACRARSGTWGPRFLHPRRTTGTAPTIRARAASKNGKWMGANTGAFSMTRTLKVRWMVCVKTGPILRPSASPSRQHGVLDCDRCCIHTLNCHAVIEHSRTQLRPVDDITSNTAAGAMGLTHVRPLYWSRSRLPALAVRGCSRFSDLPSRTAFRITCAYISTQAAMCHRISVSTLLLMSSTIEVQVALAGDPGTALRTQIVRVRSRRRLVPAPV